MCTLRPRPALLASLVVGVVATMGLGFALWSDQLNVGATVDTGNLKVELDAGAREVADNTTDNASCVAENVGNEARVTFTDAFPGYSCNVTTFVGNVGTVDAVLKSATPSGTPTIDGAQFDIKRLSPPKGAADRELYPDGDIPKAGPAWRVTFQSNDNTTEYRTGVHAYHLTFSAVFENAAPTP